MPLAPSMLSLMAACFYGAVAMSCLIALAHAIGRRQITWHALSWGAIAALFLVLIVMRFFALEELLRGELRLVLRVEGAYDDRRALQGPIFAALFIVAATIGAFWLFTVSRRIRGRRNIATMIAIACACGITFLMLLRIVSLHSVDALLYGPLKLNWIIDIGLSAVVLGCGVQYWRVLTGKA